MKQLNDKQLKAGGIIALVLISIHFFPALVNTASRLFSPAPPVHPKPSAAIPYPPAPAHPAGPSGLSPQIQAAFLGKWQGMEMINNDNCRVMLEIRISPEQPDQVSGYETRNCFAVSPPADGKAPPASIAQLLKNLNPVSTVMTGGEAQGNLAFRVDKTIGTAPDVCPMTSYSVSPFGGESIVAQWQEGSCGKGSGQMVLTRYRG